MINFRFIIRTFYIVTFICVLNLFYLSGSSLAKPHFAKTIKQHSSIKKENFRKLIASETKKVSVRDVEGLLDYVRENYQFTNSAFDDVSVTLVDLDEEKDGVPEILLKDPTMCGSGGCPLGVLKQTPDGRFIPLLSDILCHDVGVSKGYKNGYRNIYINCRAADKAKKWIYKKNTLKFNGESYE